MQDKSCCGQLVIIDIFLQSIPSFAASINHFLTIHWKSYFIWSIMNGRKQRHWRFSLMKSVIMKYVSTRKLYEYWNSLRASSIQPPLRLLFNPMAIPTILSRVMLIDLADENFGNIRLAGSHLYDLYGKEISGSKFPDIWSERSRLKALDWLHSLKGNGPLPLVYSTLRYHGQSIDTEFLLLPLRSEKNEITQAIGIQSFVVSQLWYNCRPPIENDWISDKKCAEPVDIRPADVFKTSEHGNVIDLTRRGRPPEGAKKSASSPRD